MVFLFTALAGFVFGAGIQYLGTLTAGSVLGTWAWTVSGMSAPWLVLPFVAGMTQKESRRAMVLGLVVTMAALLGYFAMSNSPMEGRPVAQFAHGFVTIVRTGYNPLWIVGGLVTGPLFGLLGQRWRVARWWVSAVLVACALAFEPLARAAVGQLSSHTGVWTAEVVIGVVVAAFFAFLIVQSRRARGVDSSLPQAT